MDERSWEFFRRAVKRITPTAEQEQYSYFRVVKQHFRPGMRWLDGGCGHTLVPYWMTGGRELEKYFLSNAEMVVGTDIDAPSLEKESSIRRVACDLESVCFPDQSFDLVTMNMVVEHLADPPRVYREVYRILKPGGVLIVHTPNVLNWINLVAKFTPQWFHVLIRGRIFGSSEEDLFPVRYRSNTPGKMQEHLERTGFSQVEVMRFSGRPLAMESRLLVVAQCLVHRVVSSFPNLREILCGVAVKPGMEAGPLTAVPAASAMES